MLSGRTLKGSEHMKGISEREVGDDELRPLMVSRGESIGTKSPKRSMVILVECEEAISSTLEK